MKEEWTSRPKVEGGGLGEGGGGIDAKAKARYTTNSTLSFELNVVTAARVTEEHWCGYGALQVSPTEPAEQKGEATQVVFASR